MAGSLQFKIVLNATILSILIGVFAPEGTAQSRQDLTFYGHTLGESVEAFFSKAKMVDSGILTRDYCRKLVDDPDAVKRYETSRTGPNRKDFLLSDLPGCRDVIAALQGKGVPVGARFASELGKGGVAFADGKLVMFQLDLEKPFADVVSDIKKRLGVAGHANDMTVQGTKTKTMTWNVNGVFAHAFEIPYSQTIHISFGYTSYSLKPERAYSP